MIRQVLIAALFVTLLIYATGFESELESLRAFDDSTIYRLVWEKEQEALAKEAETLETITMVTSRKEKYTCSIPKTIETKQEEPLQYKGPNPLQLLMPLFNQMSCSYRLESFWTYELCHGRYIRQYHEERDGKKVKLQEYYLGKSDKEKIDKQNSEMDDELASGQQGEVPVKKIESMSLPYLMVPMDSGTLCDVTGKPRVTRVYYVCQPTGKHEIYSLEEASSCEYEVVVLSPFLCQHPDYRPKETEENKIFCWPSEGSPKKPASLMEIEAESQKLQQQQNLLESLGLSDRFKIEFRKIEDSRQGEKKTMAFITPAEAGKASTGKESSVKDDGQSSARLQPPPTGSTQPIFDPKLVEDFLAGEHCLHGGTGWWKYEFCYGYRAQQYHEEKDGTRTTILLGTFNEEKHLAWLEANPSKRPKPVGERKQVSHLYTDGSVCDLTNSPRRVEVKLKCKEIANVESPQSSYVQSMNAVSLYLLEPQPCEYVLGVEAPFLCPLINAADANGFIEIDNVEVTNSGRVVLTEND